MRNKKIVQQRFNRFWKLYTKRLNKHAETVLFFRKNYIFPTPHFRRTKLPYILPWCRVGGRSTINNIGKYHWFMAHWALQLVCFFLTCLIIKSFAALMP